MDEGKFCDGYDSDGESRPFIPDRIMVKTVEEEEDIVPTLEAPPVKVTVIFPDKATDTTKTTSPDDDHPEGVFVNIEVADMIKMKNSALRNELYLWKEKSSSNKDILIARLTTTISEKKPKFMDNQIRVAKGKKKAPEINSNNRLKAFTASTYWQELKPNKKRVIEPLSLLFDNPRVTTVTQRDDRKNFIKHDFDEEELDIPLFKVTDNKVKRGRNGRVMFWNKGGQGGKKVPMYGHIHCTKGVVNPEFRKKHSSIIIFKAAQSYGRMFATTQTKKERLVLNKRSKECSRFSRRLSNTCYLDKP